MKRRFRLTRSTDIQRVRRLGKSYAHPLIVLIAFPTGAAQNTRIGVLAGRAVGNAVRRSRAKRLIRAALQPFLESLAPGWDTIMIARRPLVDADFQAAHAAVASLLHRARLLEKADSWSESDPPASLERSR